MAIEQVGTFVVSTLRLARLWAAWQHERVASSDDDKMICLTKLFFRNCRVRAPVRATRFSRLLCKRRNRRTIARDKHRDRQSATRPFKQSAAIDARWRGIRGYFYGGDGTSLEGATFLCRCRSIQHISYRPARYWLPSCDCTGPLSKKIDERRRSLEWPRPARAVGPRLCRAHVPNRTRLARVIPT